MNDAEQLHGWNQSFKVEERFTGKQDRGRITSTILYQRPNKLFLIGNNEAPRMLHQVTWRALTKTLYKQDKIRQDNDTTRQDNDTMR